MPAAGDPDEDRKHLRLSLRALPVGVGIALASTGLAWAAARALRLPSWFVVPIAALAWLTPVGDAITVVVLLRRLRRGRR